MYKPLRIGVDCRLWDETGIGRYIRNILYNLADLDIENDYILFLLEKDFDKVQLPRNFHKVKLNLRWYTAWEQLILPFVLYKHKLDLFWAPNINVPVLYWKKFIVTIHDLTVLKIKTGRASTLPYPIYYAKRLLARLPIHYGAFMAKAIFTVSDYVKTDIVENLKVSAKKVHLTPCAVDARFKRVSVAESATVCTKYNITGKYLFYVGNAHPHKNLEKLITAFERVSTTYPDLQLVLGGSKAYFYERLEDETLSKKIAEKVHFIGYVDDQDLPALYSGAELFVNPSLHEGFGIQILEAFACGTRVVCSKTSSLPEVGGNIAYYFNPYDVANMAEVILLALKDRGETDEKRVEAGYTQVKKFSWLKSAEVVYKVILQI